MYVRVREGSRQGQSSYVFSPHFGSYLGELGQPQTLPERLRSAWSARHNKQEMFKLLRERLPLSVAEKTDVITALRSIFTVGSDELWLAETLARHGSEPLWPLAEITQRFQRVKSLGADPGNYQATLPDPHPGGPLTGALAACTDRLKNSQLPSAFFFPGRSDHRALIISGVHGDERRGVKVVQSLQRLLATTKPFFTTILVPVVIPRTQAGAGQRNVPGGMGMSKAGTVKCRQVEPNRNFPLPGEGLVAARARGSSSPNAAELVFQPASGSLRNPRGDDESSIRMLPETRILISLIERFQPERLASVHDHSLKQNCHPCNGRKIKCGGEGPGIFVDLRGIDPTSGAITNNTQVEQDDRLARRMVEAALRRLPCSISLLQSAKIFPPFAGNQAFFPVEVRYFSKQRVEGNSLGDWAPVPAGGRPGITTLTIEVPKYKSAQAAAEKRVIDLHRDLLQEIFLGSL
jgi:hypothetical protein